MHRRSRTALSVSAALLVAAPLLAACGSEAHPGAAAVVGGERITVAQLEGRVNELRDAQRAVTSNDEEYADLLKAQCDAALRMQQPQSCDLARVTLNTMVFDQVFEKAAQDAGVVVTRKEVQTRRAAQEKQLGGPEGLRRAALRGNVAPGQLDATLRTQLQIQKLNQKLGDAGFGEAVIKASDALDIDLNPRYGTWNIRENGRVDADTPWLREVTSRSETDART
ncbi:SurA N-terminal domain-containing protein [Streptomyces sp. O3]